jgi:uncharacterized protein (DUF983 family)
MSEKKVCPECGHGNLHLSAHGCLKLKDDGKTVCGCKSAVRSLETFPLGELPADVTPAGSAT